MAYGSCGESSALANNVTAVGTQLGFKLGAFGVWTLRKKTACELTKGGEPEMVAMTNVLRAC